MRPYTSGGWRWEMSRNDHYVSISEALEEPPPGRSSHFRVDAKAAVELRLGTLQSGMHDVATQDHGCSLRTHQDADVTGCVPRPRLDPYTVVKGKVGGNQLSLATLHDRQQAVFKIGVGGISGS